MPEFTLKKAYKLHEQGRVAVFLSRHEPQKKQLDILKEQGISMLYWVIGNVNNPNELVDLVTQYSADVLIPILPPMLLAPVLSKLQRLNKEVWIWRMERKQVSLEEAEELAEQGITVDVDVRSGTAVAFIPVELSKLVKIEIVTEPIWRA